MKGKTAYFIAHILPPLLPLMLGGLLLEWIVKMEWVQSWLVPAPSSVMQSIWNDRQTLLEAMGETSLAALIGFAISVVLGILIAIILTTGKWVQRTFYPYAVFFQTVPIIAIAPLLVIWFGFTINAVIASALIVSIFPVIANTLAGLLSVDPALDDMFKLYRASKFATLMKLRLPFALPSIFTGLRVASGLAVIGAIVGEFITGTGLGGLLTVARQQRRIDLVFATLLMASLLGIILFALINLTSRLSLRHWHASEK